MSPIARVTRNIIAKYGRKGLESLLADFERGISGQETADRMGVSRERVRQWRHTLGSSISIYQVHPEVLVVRDERIRG